MRFCSDLAMDSMLALDRGAAKSRLKKVDDAFWEKFLAVKSGHEMAVTSCYEK
jgi:hypothetical protein